MGRACGGGGEHGVAKRSVTLLAGGVAQPQRRGDGAKAKLGLLAVGLLWGLNWPAVKLTLQDLTPWTTRAAGLTCGALALLAFARATGRSLHIRRGLQRLHLVVAGLLSVAGFSLCSAFAQLGTSTSRAAICAYTMPIWTILLARPILGERIDRSRSLAVAAGTGGLLLLLWPLFTQGIHVGVVFALGAALSWAAGTIYQKWAAIEADPLALAAWQLAVAAVAALLGAVASGTPLPSTMHAIPAAALCFTAFGGTALGYLLWFGAVARLPAGTAGLGSLLAPVVGVAGSALLLGERPPATDLGGFALIIVAALCALAPRTVDGTVPAGGQAG